MLAALNQADAREALVNVLAGVGLPVAIVGPDSVRIRVEGSDPVELRVHPVSVGRGDLANRLANASKVVVVADQLPAQTRARLDEKGIAWLDRRGHLKVVIPPLWIDVDVPPCPREGTRTSKVDPLGGAVVAGVSLLALVSSPDPLPGIRGTARLIGATPGGVSLAASRLIEAGLLTRDRRAAIPNLFWASAEAWRPRWTGLRSIPSPSDGIIAVGTVAAAALGAGLAHTADYPVELLAATPTQLRDVVGRYGSPLEGAPARITLAPSPIAADRRATPEFLVSRIPVARAAIVALTLATDPARGAEALEQWEPAGRVW